MGWRDLGSDRVGRPLSRLLPRGLRQDEKGATAIEFAIVALPFLMMLFGIIAVGLYFFTTFALENAVEQASRQLRTGQAQLSSPPMTAANFKTRVCNFLPGNFACDGKLQVKVKAYANSADINAANIPKCLNNNGTINTTTDYTLPNANAVVLVWACYEWEMGGKLPYLSFPGAMSNGSLMIQAATTFRVEPFQ